MFLLLLLAWPTWMWTVDDVEAEESGLERDKRSPRGISLSVPSVFAGLRVSPDVWRWMISAYGSSAITSIGVTVSESDADARSKRGSSNLPSVAFSAFWPLGYVCALEHSTPSFE